jgi:lipopolysaccharide assembly outer membrane protein LptD (OstA)
MFLKSHEFDIFYSNPSGPIYMKNIFFHVCIVLFIPVYLCAQDSAVTDSTVSGDSIEVMQDDSAAVPDSVADSARIQKEDTLVYYADSISYGSEQEILELHGNAKVVYQNMVLTADTIIYDSKTNIAEAVGIPELKDRDQIIYGESMECNIKTKRGAVSHGTTTQNQGLYNGRRIYRLENNVINAHFADYSTCLDTTHTHFYFYGRRMKIIPGKKVVCRPVVLNIQDVPVAILPYFIFPLKKGRRSGILLPKWGERSEKFGNITVRGMFLHDLGFYWAASDYFDVTFKGDFDNGSGFFFQDMRSDLTLNYRKRYWITQGYLHGYLGKYQSDEGEKQNWRFDYAHRQNLLPDESWTLYGRGNLMRDKNEMRRFSLKQSEILRRELYSNLTTTRSWREKKISLTVTADQRRNLENNERTEALPNYSLSFTQRALIKPPEKKPGQEQDSLSWFHNIRYGFNSRGANKRYFAPDTLTEKDIQRGITELGNDYSTQSMRHDASISMPQNLAKYFTLTPAVNYSESWFWQYTQTDSSWIIYDTTIDSSQSLPETTVVPRKTYDWRIRDTIIAMDSIIDTVDGFNRRGTYNASLSLGTKLYGTLQPNWGRFGGIRHTLSPTVSLYYSPEREGWDRYLRGTAGYMGNSVEQRAIRMSLGNLFQTKILGVEKEGEKITQDKKLNLVNINFSTAYNFKADSLKLSNLASSANTNIYGLNFRGNATHRFYDWNGNLNLKKPYLMQYGLSLSTGLRVGGKFHNGIMTQDLFDTTGLTMSPWNIGVRFSTTYSRNRIPTKDVFTENKNFSLGGNLNMALTKRWKMAYSNSYDLISNTVAYQSFTFTCDLHCWEAVFNWFPTGFSRGYYFRINIKELRDVKMERRKGGAGSYGSYGTFR